MGFSARAQTFNKKKFPAIRRKNTKHDDDDLRTGYTQSEDTQLETD